MYNILVVILRDKLQLSAPTIVTKIKSAKCPIVRLATNGFFKIIMLWITNAKIDNLIFADMLYDEDFQEIIS